LIDEKRRLIRELVEACETVAEAQTMFLVATRLNCDNMALFDAIQWKVDRLNGATEYTRGHVYED
jgi:hypothetical protein